AVDKDMALNEDKLNDFLIMLGINGAEFVVDGCEEKCKLTISNLKSKDEANIIIAAFDEFGNTVLKELTPIIEDQSITILKRINLKLTNDIKNENNIKNNVNLYILDLLKNLNDSEKVKIGPWVSKKSGDSGFGVLKIVDEDSNPLQIGYYLGTQEIGDYSNFDVSNDSNYVSYNIRHYFEGDDELVSLEKDGIMTLYNLNNPDDVAHLDSLGITINTARICNGEFPAVIYTPKKALMPSESQKSDKATEDILPDEYRLEQNYPNPFNPTTTIIFSLPISEKVTLEIFNFEGRLVRTLINDVKDAGIHYIIWDGRNDKGGKVASGMYVYKITAGDFIDTKKMTLIK
ncbi:MAG: FlgD immunoglobulin-like domain containing protein, partial [Candidatus Zixiibacteriota bacterium]